MALSFPTAAWPDVRRVVGRHVAQVPGAKGQCAAAIALLAGGSVANIFIPILLGRIVDAVIAGGGANLFAIGVGLAVCALLGAALSAGGFYLLSRITERVIANLREDMVGTALGMPTHRVEEAGTGDLVSRSTDDVAELSAAVTETVPVLSSSVFAIITTAVALV